MNHRLPSKRPLALSLLVCLLAPGLALAQAGSPREEALEARVAELEKQVQLLLAQQQQTQQTVTEVQAVQASMPAPKPDDGKPKIQSTPINTAGVPGTRFSYGGFIKLDAMVTDTPDGEIADGSVASFSTCRRQSRWVAPTRRRTPTWARSSRASGSAPTPRRRAATS